MSLRDGADMLALSELDQKLWVALAMPVRGLDIAPETLTLLDHDHDNRIRVQDVLSAVAWAKATFKQPGDLLVRKDEVALSALADEKVVAAARRMLSDLGKPDAKAITVEDSAAVTKAFADTVLNGDGIVIPASTEDAELRKVIEDAIARVGSVTDRSGKPGIDTALAQAFFTDVDTRAGWLAEGKAAAVVALGPPGPATGAASEALAAVRAKIEDYFTRCRVAAFDARGATALAGQEPELVALGARMLSESDEQLAQLPLATIAPAARLPLGGTVGSINPAWRARIDAFVRDVVTPILGAREHFTPDDLAAITAALAPHQAWLDRRPATKVNELDEDWIARLAGPDLRKQLDQLIAADSALGDEYAQISAVTKAVHMQRDFGRILRNFVNFSDFYARQDGVFQTGTLYLDARALRLCVTVSDAAKHGAQIGASDMFLAYCDLTRQGETRQIVAALTNGDVDSVFAGRNGIFYDRAGNDWDATITKVVANPISIRAAFWSPYKKLVKTIEDTVAKRAAASETRSASLMESTGSHIGSVDEKALAEAGAPPPQPTAAPKPTKIDLGTVAAIGVAIGGIGTLVGVLLGNLFGLGKWLPLGILALLLMISGPSMLLAWLKLRRRNLGPVLEANGWAINGRTRINVAFGAAMTELPRLPPGSKRSLDDPFADKRTPWRLYVIILVLAGLFGAWYLSKFDDILPEAWRATSVLGEHAPAYKRPAAPAAAPAPAAPAPAPAPAAPAPAPK
ncbi:MAG TPA: hypothetical protein VLM79_08295 [Kofleriaceae bacterium]|nr:hypothetical protein [Kofleriaceae bacterium]